MRIVVEDVPESGERREGTVELDLSGFDADAEVVVSGPVAYRFDIGRFGSTVEIEGRVETRVEAPCSRCARPVEIDVDRAFRAVFVTDDTGEADAAVELDAKDLDLDYYQGGVIDGRRLLAEQIFLELPMKLLCAEDCKGLCDQCGANLNEIECECEPRADPRWSALNGLRDRL